MVDRAIGRSLRALSQLARSPLLAKAGLSGSVERWLYQGTKMGLKAAREVSKRARPAVKLLEPLRMGPGSDAKPDGFDLRPTEAQELVRDTMARFAREVMRPSAQKADELGAPDPAFLAAVHELGLAHMAVPEVLGGAGETRSMVTNVLVAEELARGDMGLALVALAPLAVAHALVDFGTPAQQGTYLPSFVGERFYPAAFALLEPRPLFDPDHPSTRAVSNNGDYVLTGEKALVPLGESAELFLVTADLGGRPQAFLVEAGAPGLTVVPEPTMGLRAAGLARIKLNGVRVPRAQRLGEEAGVDGARLVDLARIAWGAMAVGTGSAVLDYVTQYAKERIAFGEPIAHRQSVAFMIADMALELDALRLMVYRAASRAEYGRTFRREAALVRVQAAEKGMQVGTNGVQLLGGHGFIKEHPVELWYRHLRALGVVEGALCV